jgi:hypothetical protein
LKVKGRILSRSPFAVQIPTGYVESLTMRSIRRCRWASFRFGLRALRFFVTGDVKNIATYWNAFVSGSDYLGNPVEGGV